MGNPAFPKKKLSLLDIVSVNCLKSFYLLAIVQSSILLILIHQAVFLERCIGVAGDYR